MSRSYTDLLVALNTRACAEQQSAPNTYWYDANKLTNPPSQLALTVLKRVWGRDPLRLKLQSEIHGAPVPLPEKFMVRGQEHEFSRQAKIELSLNTSFRVSRADMNRLIDEISREIAEKIDSNPNEPPSYLKELVHIVTAMNP